MAISPDGKVVARVRYHLADGQPDPVIGLWDIATGKPVGALSGHTGRVNWLRFAPDGKVLASAGQDGVRLWNLATGKVQYHLKVPATPIAFSPDGKLLAFVGEGKAVCLWEIATGKPVRRWDSEQEATTTLVFSPDGAYLAAGGRGSVGVWTTADGKKRGWFPEQGRVFTLAFSPSGRVLAVGGIFNNCTIRLWEVFSGQQIRAIDGEQVLVFALAFAPDSRTLASGGGDSTILVWDLTASADSTSSKSLAELWTDLAGQAAVADRAIWVLANAPKTSVPFLQERLRAQAPADPQQTAKLVADLQSKNYAVRQTAAQTLIDWGESVEAALRKILKDRPTLELQRRLEQILQKREQDVLRQLRAIAALEYVGTAEARQVLTALAASTPNPHVAQAANAALERLTK
jgi:dipeptidyl aminopeptidase/acylaminoacyl peptidase